MAKKTPQRRQCGAMGAHYRLLEQHPSFRTKQMTLEHSTERRMSAKAAKPSIVKIPTVVHVVYKLPAENITDAQVHSQFAVLNDDFRCQNGDRNLIPGVWKGLAADSFVEFALATEDAAGKATTGITRTQTKRDGFGTGDTVKFKSSGGVNAWPTNKFLNIWVCTLQDGLLGYAQFPGGPKATDGVVILNTAFGTIGTAHAPFNRGRTTTHEIGHWLNLRHIWGDTEDCSGTDFVADTPNAAGPNYGKPTFPSVSCKNGPNGDMFMNYMDYVDDDSMHFFTTQQVARMRAALSGPRSTF